MVFITVRFGGKFSSRQATVVGATCNKNDDKSALFNPNCRNVNLLQDIKTKCQCNLDDDFDLSDEAGEVANIASHPDDCGKNYLPERGDFILVRVERELDGEDERVTYTPMLYGMKNEKDFLDRLNPRPTKDGKSRKRGGRDDTVSPSNRRRGRNSTASKKGSRQGGCGKK